MKVTIVGAGNVGTACTYILAQKNIVKEIVLLDNKKNIAKGKALDISQSSYIGKHYTKITGINDDEYYKTNSSEIVIITSGITRKEGMSRNDILNYNIEIVKDVSKKLYEYSPDAKFIIVSNPLDIMTYITYKTINIKSKKLIGMSGLLDISRYCTLISNKTGFAITDIQALLIGIHGDKMLPLPNYTTISGIPLNNIIKQDTIDQIIEKTKYAGGNIIKLLGTSAWFTPGAAIAELVEIIIKDLKKIICCSVLLKGEYGLKNLCIGVPIVLGKNGIEKIIELKLNKKEENIFQESASNIEKIISKIKI